jgi:predicted  nucleic acid-binding Zn-ribbon protein
MSMAAVKEHYAQEKQQLLQREQELASGKADLQRELEDSRLLTSQLQTDINSIRHELDKVTTDFKVQGNDYEGRLAEITEERSSEIYRLTRNIRDPIHPFS